MAPFGVGVDRCRYFHSCHGFLHFRSFSSPVVAHLLKRCALQNLQVFKEFLPFAVVCCDAVYQPIGAFVAKPSGAAKADVPLGLQVAEQRKRLPVFGPDFYGLFVFAAG